jgi:putative cell wall-binding protein
MRRAGHRRRLLPASILALALLLVELPGAAPARPAAAQAPAPGGPVVERVAGPDRFATAAAVARRIAEPGVSAVWIARGDLFPDALGGAAAAARDGEPVLLVEPDGIPAATAEALRALRPQRIVVLGGGAAVSPQVEARLRDFTDGDVQRLAGPSRFDTAAAVAAARFDAPAPVFVATGGDFPDALAASAAAGREGAPVLLSPQDGLSGEDALSRLRPPRVTLLGGTAALADAVEAELRTYTPGATVRVAGAERTATAAALSARQFPSATDTVVIATGEDFPDAIASAPLAVHEGAPVLLAQPCRAPLPTLREIRRLQPERILVVGGEAAVCAAVLDELAAAARRIPLGPPDAPVPPAPQVDVRTDEVPRVAAPGTVAPVTVVTDRPGVVEVEVRQEPGTWQTAPGGAPQPIDAGATEIPIALPDTSGDVDLRVVVVDDEGGAAVEVVPAVADVTPTAPAQAAPDVAAELRLPAEVAAGTPVPGRIAVANVGGPLDEGLRIRLFLSRDDGAPLGAGDVALRGRMGADEAFADLAVREAGDGAVVAVVPAEAFLLGAASERLAEIALTLGRPGGHRIVATVVGARSGTAYAAGARSTTVTAAGTPATEPGPDEGTIRGIATLDGEPLVEAEVAVRSLDGAIDEIVVTDDDGRYAVGPVPEGVHDLAGDIGAAASPSVPVEVTGGEVVIGIDLDLVSPPEEADAQVEAEADRAVAIGGEVDIDVAVRLDDPAGTLDPSTTLQLLVEVLDGEGDPVAAVVTATPELLDRFELDDRPALLAEGIEGELVVAADPGEVLVVIGLVDVTAGERIGTADVVPVLVPDDEPAADVVVVGVGETAVGSPIGDPAPDADPTVDGFDGITADVAIAGVDPGEPLALLVTAERDGTAVPAEELAGLEHWGEPFGQGEVWVPAEPTADGVLLPADGFAVDGPGTWEVGQEVHLRLPDGFDEPGYVEVAVTVVDAVAMPLDAPGTAPVVVAPAPLPASIALVAPTTGAPARVLTGAPIGVTFTTDRAGTYLLEVRSNGSGAWQRADGPAASGAVPAGETTVAVSAPAAAGDLDLRLTLTTTDGVDSHVAQLRAVAVRAPLAPSATIAFGGLPGTVQEGQEVPFSFSTTLVDPDLRVSDAETLRLVVRVRRADGTDVSATTAVVSALDPAPAALFAGFTAAQQPSVRTPSGLAAGGVLIFGTDGAGQHRIEAELVRAATGAVLGRAQSSVLTVVDPPPAPADVRVQQIATRGPAGLSDELIQVTNRTAAPVAIGGWRIRSCNNRGFVATRYTVDAGVVLAPGQSILAASRTYSGPGIPDGTRFQGAITDEGGVRLERPDGTKVDGVGFSVGAAACVEGRPAANATPAQYEQQNLAPARDAAGANRNDNVLDFSPRPRTPTGLTG